MCLIEGVHQIGGVNKAVPRTRCNVGMHDGG